MPLDKNPRSACCACLVYFVTLSHVVRISVAGSFDMWVIPLRDCWKDVRDLINLFGLRHMIHSPENPAVLRDGQLSETNKAVVCSMGLGSAFVFWLVLLTLIQTCILPCPKHVFYLGPNKFKGLCRIRQWTCNAYGYCSFCWDVFHSLLKQTVLADKASMQRCKQLTSWMGWSVPLVLAWGSSWQNLQFIYSCIPLLWFSSLLISGIALSVITQTI